MSGKIEQVKPSSCFYCEYMAQSWGGQTVGCKEASKAIPDMDKIPDWCPKGYTSPSNQPEVKYKWNKGFNNEDECNGAFGFYERVNQPVELSLIHI